MVNNPPPTEKLIHKYGPAIVAAALGLLGTGATLYYQYYRKDHAAPSKSESSVVVHTQVNPPQSDPQSAAPPKHKEQTSSIPRDSHSKPVETDTEPTSTLPIPTITSPCNTTSQFKVVGSAVATRTGYIVTLHVENGSEYPSSIWGNSYVNLNDSDGQSFNGGTTLPMPSGGTFWAVERSEQSLPSAYGLGIQIPVGETRVATFTFGAKDVFFAAATATLSTKAEAVFKLPDGHYRYSPLIISCEDLPVRRPPTR